MLVGYRVASEIHGSGESFEFWNGGPFAEWLWKRLSMPYPSALGWAVEIERAAEIAEVPAMEMSPPSWMSSAANVPGDRRPNPFRFKSLTSHD
jgi:hypothetical protein